MKYHLLRPYGVTAMCGRPVGSVLLTMDPEVAECKTCLARYENNVDWYKNQTEGR